MTLRLKLLVLVAGVALFSATGVATLALWNEIVHAQAQLACEGSAAALAVASAIARSVPAEAALASAAGGRPKRVWITDAESRLVACVDDGGARCTGGAPESTSSLDAIARLVRRLPVDGSAPIVRGDERLGTAHVAFRADGVLAEAQRLASRAAAMAAAWIALGLGLGTVLLRRITRPLTEVVRAAEALPDAGRIEVKVDEADRELRDLIGAFNRLATRLRESRGETEALIASLNERVAAATAEGLRAERLVTLGAIAAGFAHEMGNSLHVIVGFAAAALRDLPVGHANRPDLDAIRREVTRATALLDRFLFFARARSARPEERSVEPVIREAVDVLRPAAAEAHVATEVIVEAELPPLRLDAELIRQAFLNLGLNALQAMKGGGRLRVRALQHGQGVAVEFHDTGPGIAAEVRERIFEPFFTTKPEGTGLGLAIVRQAAEAHGGSIEVESPPGGGALFRLWLPAAVEEAAA